jgi:hypothetical protein
MFDKWASRPDPEGKYTVIDLITAGKYHKLYTWNHESLSFEDAHELPSDPEKLYEYYVNADICDISNHAFTSGANKKDPSEQSSVLSSNVILSSVDESIIDELLNGLD